MTPLGLEDCAVMLAHPGGIDHGVVPVQPAGRCPGLDLAGLLAEGR
jgi:hypothetical protein